MIAGWNRKYLAKIQSAQWNTPDFSDKIPQLFWRGGDSGMQFPSWDKLTKEMWMNDFQSNTMAEQRNETNWFLWPRVRLCLLSTLVPSLVDAKITNSHFPSLNEIYLNAKITAHRIPIEDQLQHKYAIHIDGSGASDRLYWMLKSKSLVFIQETPIKIWVHRGLIPYQHYIPVKEDLSDLIDQILWAEGHPEESAAIVEAADHFASMWMNFDAVVYYFYQALKQYSTVWQTPKDAA